MGITGVRMFVKASEPTTVEDVLDHFDHVKKLVGPEFLGVGSDIDLYGYDAMPAQEWLRCMPITRARTPSARRTISRASAIRAWMFRLTEGLIRRGYSDAEMHGILGGNFRRVLGKVWRDGTVNLSYICCAFAGGYDGASPEV